MPRSPQAFFAALIVFALAAPCLAQKDRTAGKEDQRPSGDSLVKLLEGEEDFCEREKAFPGKDGLLSAIGGVLNRAKRSPPEKREEIVKAGLDDINEAARTLDRAQPELRRRINGDLSHLNNRAGNWRPALDFAEKALEDDPDDRDALVSRSDARYGLKNYEAAFADASRAAKLDPDSPEAFRARAMAAYGLRNYLQATEDARRALALDPNDRTAFAIMKLAEGKVPVLRLDDMKSHMAGEAQREYHGMVQQLSQVEEKRREPEEAPAPQSAERLVKNAAAKIAVKDYWGAIEDSSRAIAEDPANLAAYYYRAAADNLVGRYEEAVQDATRALVINPSDTSARDARAWAFNRIGRFRDAMADAAHSMEANPKNAYAYANLGYSHEQTGDLAAMLRELKAAAEINPQFEPAYRDAAARHGLEPEPLPSDRFEAPRGRIPARERSRRRSFLVVLASSLVGGLLIAMGFVQLGVLRPAGGAGTAGVRAPSAIDKSYAVGRSIGMGGMGVVYEAVDRVLRRKVAIKMMREEFKRDLKAKERFLEEARTVAALHHPGIVDIHSIVEDEAGLYLVFEHVEGRTVHDLLQEKRRLSLREAKAVMKQVCSALDFAHRHNVVHRDLKPSNIMITEQGQAKVMDFGISRHAKDALQQLSLAETAMGTPYYMAPEQGYGQIRKESDLFSLGVCLYEMVTGSRPFADPAGAPQKAARDYPKPSRLAAGLPPELDDLIAWALHPDPDQRIRTARDFWAFLERIKDPAAEARIS